MIQNNLFNSIELTTNLWNIDLRFAEETFGNNDNAFVESSTLIKNSSETFDYLHTQRRFFEDVINIVQKMVINDSFDVGQIATELNVSTSTLHRKINQLTGLTPYKFILSYRIKLAQQLLLNNSLNISQVAYEVGFKDPRYFSRCFRKETGLTPKEYRISIKRNAINDQSNDQLFLEKVLVKLETKISDSNLSLDLFATEMNVSKTSLYRKIKSVVGLSPCEFIRSVRIKRSAQLLNKHSNITDVSLAVGFNDSKYFSRCFKIEFGVTPTQYQEFLAC